IPEFVLTTLKIGAKSGGARRVVKDVAFARGGVCATDARKSARLKHFPLSHTSSGGKFGGSNMGGHDAEDSNRNRCVLDHTGRRRRSDAQGAASSGASGWQGSDRQVSGGQGSDRQVSTARRDQGLTAATTRGRKPCRRCEASSLF